MSLFWPKTPTWGFWAKKSRRDGVFGPRFSPKIARGAVVAKNDRMRGRFLGFFGQNPLFSWRDGVFGVFPGSEKTPKGAERLEFQSLGPFLGGFGHFWPKNPDTFFFEKSEGGSEAKFFGRSGLLFGLRPKKPSSVGQKPRLSVLADWRRPKSFAFRSFATFGRETTSLRDVDPPTAGHFDHLRWSKCLP